MMGLKRQILIASIFGLSIFLWAKWQAFQTAQQQAALTETQVEQGNVVPNSPANVSASNTAVNTTTASGSNTDGVPTVGAPIAQINQDGTSTEAATAASQQFITVTTDLATIKINTQGGGIESLVLKEHAVAAETPEIGFDLLKNTNREVFVSQSGLIGNTGSYPNHNSLYSASQTVYDLGDADKISVPLTWVSEEGNQFVKTFTFHKDSYLITLDYQATNNSAQPWSGFLYAQFKRTQPLDANSGSFMQLPSFMGGVKYTDENKYDKVSFKDIQKKPVAENTDSGWVGMLQHYFAGVWMPQAIANNGNANTYGFYSNYTPKANPEYIMGYKTLSPLSLQAGETGTLSTRAFIGPKENDQLHKIEDQENVEGLSLSIDYGWLTVVSDPLFWALDKIHNLVGNWGWAIIILTILIKLVFFPLSAASYKSMARMKKLQPRMETLKERFGDDRQGLQQEMMKLYKEEKVNPAGGCLPILIQIPVFIALYYVLLESVELRHAPFALWIQDMSSKDPYFILPILMGLSMMLQFRLNPAPMEPIQQKIMTFMPIVMTFLFITFPAGLVLYWVVNNVLSIAQQWTINRTIGKEK
jgi:YidC/Oxa1 family membrane protein insertase